MTRLACLCIVAVSFAGIATAGETSEATQSDAPAIVTIDQLSPDVVRGQCPDGKCKHESECRDDCKSCKRNGMFAKLKRRFGYFCPTGNCGRGMPLWGKYHMVYAAQPGYTDPRDGYTYAAPGYGTPVNVPLAPNVRHSYNYSWGIPSSRLTPMRQGVVVGPPEPVAHHAPVWHY